MIVTSTLIYLTLVIAYSKSSNAGGPSLREAFPQVFRHGTNNRQAQQHKSEEIHDEPAVYHDETPVLKTLVLGIPDWQEWEFSYLTIALNVLVTLLSLDLVYRGPLLHNAKDLTFTRLGYIDDTSAKVLLRDPHTENLPIFVYIRPTTQTAWTGADTIYQLSEDTDYTYPIIFKNLQPETSYTFSLSNDLQGTFKTNPAPKSPRAKSLTFLTSSCIKANFPYNPLAHSLSIPGFKHMSKALRLLSSPASFMLFLGDFIYVDVPLRLSSSQEHYRSEYRRVYASPSWKLPGVSLPWIHTLDDHEIANDWNAGNQTDPFPAASDPFVNYHVSVNPPVPPGSPKGPEVNTTYFQFVQGPAAFFLMDTRRYRTRPETTKTKTNTSKPLTVVQEADQAPTMLGPVQLQALLSFLQKPEGPNVHWKVVATSVPFTKNWRFGTSDTWGGFLQERSKILQAMHFAEENLGVRVVILSGDRHEFAAIRYPPLRAITGPDLKRDSTPGIGPHEFSVGPLSMFYLPFRTFKQVDDEDVAIAYFPDGNSKLGSVEITPSEKYSSTLKYTLWINGNAVWNHSLTSPSPAVKGRSHLASWGIKWQRV